MWVVDLGEGRRWWGILVVVKFEEEEGDDMGVGGVKEEKGSEGWPELRGVGRRQPSESLAYVGVRRSPWWS